MPRGISKKTKRLTAAAVLAAMGVALLFIGSIIKTLDLSMAALASFFCIFAVIELGSTYSWLVFAVTGILSVVLMPANMGGWFYLLFFGYYPILKEKFEKLRPLLAWVVKITVLNAAMILSVVIATFIIYGGNLYGAIISIFGTEKWGIYAAIGMYALVNAVFVVYDVALTRLISVYLFKLRDRFKFLR